MLTADLVQARLYKGQVKPRYVDVEDAELLALAERLIDTFAAHEGASRAELEGELQEILGTGTEFLLHRALAKLLFDRSTFETESKVEPEELRREIFRAAAAAYRREPEPRPDAEPDEDDAHPFRFDRPAVLAEVAAGLELEPAEIEQGLYADLKQEQVLVSWRPCRPRWLLERYNVALAQGVLLRAGELTIRLREPDVRRQRALFRQIKFHRLLHRVERDGEGGWRIRLDGPLSLFQASGKYGVQMASFLPTLLHFERWSLAAEVRWGKRRRRVAFELSPKTGLVPHTRLTGQWRPDELRGFAERFAKLDSGWEVTDEAEVVPLGGQGVLVPDFVFRHRDGGERVYLEVLGFWRRGAVESRLELLRRHGPRNVVLAISKALAAGRDELDQVPGEVYVFRSTPIARKVLAILERLREPRLEGEA